MLETEVAGKAPSSNFELVKYKAIRVLSICWIPGRETEKES